jgi:hypothetical protein
MLLVCVSICQKSFLWYEYLILDIHNLDTIFKWASMWGSVVMFWSWKGVHKLNVLGSTDINDVSCSFISAWQIFFEKCFVQFPTYFCSLKLFFCCLQVLSRMDSLCHVTVSYCIEFIFIFPKTKLQIIVENGYWLNSTVNSSTIIRHYILSRNKMCEKLCFIFCARKIMYFEVLYKIEFSCTVIEMYPLVGMCMLKKILNFVTVSFAKITTKSFWGGIWTGSYTLHSIFGPVSVDTNCLQNICNFPYYSQWDGYWYFQLERSRGQHQGFPPYLIHGDYFEQV